MKSLKLIFSVILCITIIFTCCAGAGGLYTMSYLFGDADGDHRLTILDSTRIQRHLADMTVIEDEFLLYAADIDHNDSVTIMDATRIQRILCELEELSPEEMYFDNKTVIGCLYADHDSGRTYVGDTVHFYVNATTFNTPPIRYRFVIDGVTVQESESASELEYTFTQAGNYYIEVYAYNRFGTYAVSQDKFLVSEASERPTSLYLTGHHYNNSASNPFSADIREVHENNGQIHTLTVHCAGGTAPYLYRFDFDNGAQTSEFTENNSFDIEDMRIGTDEFYHEYPLIITVRDAEGEEIRESVVLRLVLPEVG